MSEATPNPSEPIRVEAFLAMCMQEVSSLAWAKMGLQPDPMTGKIEKDMEQAKLAIDASETLFKLIEGSLDDDDKRQVQNLMRDLKVNYASQK